jgi:putative holliday junction resolvase
MAFDYGERRIGVAVGQMITGTASPLTTLRCRADGPDWEAIAALVQAWRPDALVVGQPGGEFEGAHKLRAAILEFKAQLASRFALPVHTADEAYTSVEAYARLKIRRRTQSHGKRIAKDEIDRLSAAILLEAWMSSLPAAPASC